jgi:hypothetical protein
MDAKEIDFKSGLPKPIQRAMSDWLRFAIGGKIITHADLIAHFGIAKVITSLSAEVRGLVLCKCNGGGDPVRAAKMKAEIVASTIASMLEDKLVSAEDICQEISTDHMVEVLSSQELYRLVFGKPGEKKRWLHEGKAKPASKAFMVAVHRVLQAESLLGDKTATEYVKALGEEKFIHDKTPPRLLVECQRQMLARNRDGKLFTDDDLLKVYAPNELIQYVDLVDLFKAVEAVAVLNTWVEEPKPAEPPSPAAPPQPVVNPDDEEKRKTGRPPPDDSEPDLEIEVGGADMSDFPPSGHPGADKGSGDGFDDDTQTQVATREDVEAKGRAAGGSVLTPPPLPGKAPGKR